MGMESATVLFDLAKFYEYVDHGALWKEVEATGFPP